MSTIVTRAGKGSPLTNAEVDANFNNLNADKAETGSNASFAQVDFGGLSYLSDAFWLMHADQNALTAVRARNDSAATNASAGVSLIAGDNDFSIATYATTSVNGKKTIITANSDLDIYSPLVTFTGEVVCQSLNGVIGNSSPTSGTFTQLTVNTFLIAPTMPVDDNTTNVATTEWYFNQASATNPVMNGSVAVGTSIRFAREDHVHASDTSRAPTASPTFTGTATFNIISAAGQINSTLATGTAPLVIASTTQVANLNVSFLQGGTWAVPGALGATTPNTAEVTTFIANGNATFLSAALVFGRLAVMFNGSTANIAARIEPTTVSASTLTGTSQIAAYVNIEGTSAATSSVYGVLSRVSSANAAFTLPLGVAFQASDGTRGAASTYTQQEGFSCGTLTAATINIGFRSQVVAAANRWNAYFDGTAQNYFAGLTGFGISTPTYPVDVVAAAATAIGIRIRGRVADDLAVLSFSEDSGATEQGRISVTSANAINFATGSAAAVQVSITHVASAVNYVNLAGATTTNPPFIAAGGSDSNIALRYISKGTGNHDFYSVNGANRQFRVRGDNVAVNYLDVFGTTAGNGPIIRAEGTDSNVRLNLYSKGTESVRIGTNQGAQVAADFTHVAAAVNYPSICGAIIGSGPIIQAAGSDTNIPLLLSGKGTGAVGLYTGAATRLQVSVLDVAGANRYVTLAGSNSSNPTISTSAGDLAVGTNLNLASTMVLKVNGTQVVGARDTGWAAMTGTTNEGTVYDTATVTLAQLAGRVMALQAALTTHGLIGA